MERVARKKYFVFLRPFLLEKTQHNWLVNKTINSSFKAYKKARQNINGHWDSCRLCYCFPLYQFPSVDLFHFSKHGVQECICSCSLTRLSVLPLVHCTKGNRLYAILVSYNIKCSGENLILRGIFHVVSCFPLHSILYRGNFDYFSDYVPPVKILFTWICRDLLVIVS